MDKKILTQHPQGKQGVNISLVKYNTMKAAILKAFRNRDEVSLKQLTVLVKKDLTGRFDGSIGWYLISVKQDLEARGILEIVAGKKPQHLRKI